MSKEVINLAEKLIKFKTISHHYKEIRACAAFIERYAKDNSLYYEFHDNGNNPVLILSNGEKRKFDIMSLGHIDVVPGSDSLFIPVIEDEKLKGRGSFDMKTGVAVSLELLNWVKKENKNLDMGVVLTSDEEVQEAKSMDFVQDLGVEAKVILDIDALSGISTIVEKNKDVVFVNLISEGKRASGMLPWEGKSAIDCLMASINKLRERFPYFDIDKKPQEEPFGRHYWVNSLNIGTINGGSQINRVSDMAVAQLDFRLVNGMDGKQLSEIFNKCMVGNTYYEIRYETGFVNEDRNNPIIKEYQQIVEDVIKQKVNFLRDGRMSNSGMLKDKKGASVILHSYSGGGYHAEDEWVDLKSVNQLYNIQKKFIDKYSDRR
ncbi:MAG: M20/M25/M40 family metallo-hydrolase [Alphaproteobacteria bacterium]|nr:M20/M25/M40 family metallo-hydrolase [Alphaproteobacteria bacterium]